jgi:hypothetical protein
LKILGRDGNSDGGIAWDGKYLVVAGASLGSEATDVYQVQLSGLTGKIVNTITLDGFRVWGGMTIFARDILMSIDSTSIGRWEYPQGGEPITLKRGRQKGERVYARSDHFGLAAEIA